MLRIRTEQIKIFQPNADAAFVRRVMNYLRSTHAKTEVRFPNGKFLVAEIGEKNLHAAVRQAIRRASDYGISWKSSVLSFVVLLFLTAPNFDDHPKAIDFFSQNKTIDDETLESFLDEMTDEDWESVKANYNAAAWNLTATEGVN